LPPTSPRNVAQNINVAQTQFWSLALEHQVWSQSLIALEYNGAHGVHLYDVANTNMQGAGNVFLGDPLDTADPSSCSPLCSRPNNQYTNINNRGDHGFSHYHALNVRFQSNNLGGTGLSLQGNYTWAHALDNLSSTFSESSGASNGVGNLGYLNPLDPALDYGNSDFDIRHRVVISAIWAEPFFKDSRGLLRQVAGGYTLTPMFTARAGVPFSVIDSTNCLNCGDGGNVRYTPTAPITDYSATGITGVLGPNDFSVLTLPAANSFADPTTGFSDFGTCTGGVAPCTYPAAMTHRNAFRGPGAWNFDMAAGKTFRVTEKVNLEFRAEGFNLLNHHNLYFNGYTADAALVGSPSGVVLEAKKGGLASLTGFNTDERRFGQFALKLSF